MKRTFHLLFIAASISAAAQVPSGAIGYWPFDGNAQDMSGNGNHGTASNTSPAHDRFNQPNMAFRFNGMNSAVVVPNNSQVDVGNGVSFSFTYWQKAYQGNQDAAVIVKHEHGTWNGYNFILNNQSNSGYCTSTGHEYWYVASGAQQDACSDNPVGTDSVWHFIAGTFDANMNVATLYIDNVMQQDIGASSDQLSNSGNLCFGGHADINSYYFNGVLDDARLYHRLLTAGELTELFNECKATMPSNTTPSSSLTICLNMSAALQATAALGTVQWYSSASSTAAIGTGTAFSTPALTAAGNYTYYAGSVSDCMESTRIPVVVTVMECTSMAELMAATASLHIYPNPAGGEFNLRTEAAGEVSFVIVDQLGRQVMSGALHNGAATISHNLPKGIYEVSLLSERMKLRSQRLVIAE